MLNEFKNRCFRKLLIPLFVSRLGTQYFNNVRSGYKIIEKLLYER